MDSIDNCFNFHASGLLAVDVDDRSGNAVITADQIRRQGRFPLMRLPQELRLHIISFLLPDVEEIDPGNEGYCSQDPGSGITASLWTSYRLDGNRCEMAAMRVSRQIYEETSRYLYDRLTIIIHIDSDGIHFLRTRWGCGTLDGCCFSIPLQKMKFVWLQIHPCSDDLECLVYVRLNLISFCSTLYQLDSIRSLRIDFWDPGHDLGMHVSSDETTANRGGVPTASKYAEYRSLARGYGEENADGHLWGTSNSTGSTMVMLQPLRLLRNVGHCEIHLNPRLEKDETIMDMVGGCNEVITSTQELTIEDLKLVHDTSEELYRTKNFRWAYLAYKRDQGQQRLDNLLWQTRRWHSIEAVSVNK